MAWPIELIWLAGMALLGELGAAVLAASRGAGFYTGDGGRIVDGVAGPGEVAGPIGSVAREMHWPYKAGRDDAGELA